MEDPFHSSKYSIQHAKRHVATFETEVSIFFNSRPYASVVEHNANRTEDFHKIKLIRPMPAALSGIAFDAVNNLRPALDQACHAVGIAHGGKTRHSHFPFGDSLKQIEGQTKGKGHSSNMPQEIIDLILGFKPYKGGNDLLWSLNQLCNSQKHEIVMPSAIAVGGMHIENMVMQNAISMQFPPKWDSSKNEMVIAHLKHGSQYQNNFQIQTFIAIGDVDVIRNQPAVGVLNELVRITESIVTAIEAESLRIGLFPRS